MTLRVGGKESCVRTRAHHTITRPTDKTGGETDRDRTDTD